MSLSASNQSRQHLSLNQSDTGNRCSQTHFSPKCPSEPYPPGGDSISAIAQSSAGKDSQEGLGVSPRGGYEMQCWLDSGGEPLSPDGRYAVVWRGLEIASFVDAGIAVKRWHRAVSGRWQGAQIIRVGGAV